MPIVQSTVFPQRGRVIVRYEPRVYPAAIPKLRAAKIISKPGLIADLYRSVLVPLAVMNEPKYIVV